MNLNLTNELINNETNETSCAKVGLGDIVARFFMSRAGKFTTLVSDDKLYIYIL